MAMADDTAAGPRIEAATPEPMPCLVEFDAERRKLAVVRRRQASEGDQGSKKKSWAASDELTQT